jgi:PKD repeat protein
MNNKILPLKKSKAIHLRFLTVAIIVILLSLLIAGSGLAQRGNVQSAIFGLNILLVQATPTPTPTAAETAPSQTKPKDAPKEKKEKPAKKDGGVLTMPCLDCDPGGGGGTNEPPVSYTGGPYYTEAGEALQPYGGNSYDPDGTISSYQWNFGDGTTDVGTSPIHNYASDGIYTVTLTVTDNVGAANTSSSTVTVNANPQPVTISFDNLPNGTIVSNQYPQVTFSSENNFYFPVTTKTNCGFCQTSSPPNFISSGSTHNHEVTLDFKQPVNNLSFRVGAFDQYYNNFKVDVFTNGNFTQTVPGDGYPSYYFLLFDLTGYSNVTRIRIYDIFDPYGLGFDDFTFTPVGKVESLSLEQIASPLDTNPNASGGLSAGNNLRIFPDKQSPADTVDRRRVRVRAITSLGPNKTVYFKAFDVDDPSTDAAPVDTNGNAGSDNKGTPANSFGGLSALSTQTDSNGVASVEFTTSMQPGDNFRIVASADQSYLNSLFVSGVNINDSSGSSLPTDKAKVSPMLTVWRNLHIEVDSMGLVTGNRITGTIPGGIGCRTNPPPLSNPPCEEQTLYLDRSDIGTAYGDTFNGGNRFIPGRLISNGVWYEVVGIGCCGYECISCPPRTTVTIKTPGGVGPHIGAAYALVDDDDFDLDDGWNYDGDEGENVSRPDTSRLQVSDDPNLNVFEPAYVRPKYDVGDNNDYVPFVLNSQSESASGLISTYDFDSVGTEADNNFWTAYLLGAYQPDAEGDMDPSTEQDRSPSKVALAATDAFNGQGSSIFFEMFSEYHNFISDTFNPASTAAHEMGHLFNGEHSDGGLMAGYSSSAQTNSFTPITLNRIRSILHP